EIKAHCPGKVIVRDFSLFDRKGGFDSYPTIKALKALGSKPEGRILHFSWNDEKNVRYEAFALELTKLVAKETLVVAAAGENVDDPNRILKLEETVMGATIGKSDFGFLIGELNDKNHLSARSNYGPELFTALPPPEKKSGSSFSAPRFSARLACVLASGKNKESLQNFVKVLRVKKNSLNTLYPSLENLFPDR
ncbi:MAG: hypothetical protein K2X47_01815, partial [Bdellovibrionales bacterium]|nr:hypothetical protein [Bdellovibrionales bacterium]